MKFLVRLAYIIRRLLGLGPEIRLLKQYTSKIASVTDAEAVERLNAMLVHIVEERGTMLNIIPVSFTEKLKALDDAIEEAKKSPVVDMAMDVVDVVEDVLDVIVPESKVCQANNCGCSIVPEVKVGDVVTPVSDAVETVVTEVLDEVSEVAPVVETVVSTVRKQTRRPQKKRVAKKTSDTMGEVSPVTAALRKPRAKRPANK